MAPERIEIARIGARGDGIAETPGGPVYVPFTAPGDELEVELEPAGKEAFRGQITNVLGRGRGWREARCRHYGACGGCDMQHLAENVYVPWLGERIGMALSHQGITGVELRPPVLSPPGSRRRLALAYRRARGEVVLGLSEERSHALVDLAECPITSPALVALLAPLRACLGALEGANAGAVQMTETAVGVSLVVGLPRGPDVGGLQDLAAFAETHDLAALNAEVDGLIEPVVVRRDPVVDVDGMPVALPPGAFVQATAVGQGALIAAVAEACADASRVADLFSGLGTFALPLSRWAEVLAVEGERRLLDALERSWKRAAPKEGLRPLTIEHRDLFRRPLLPAELARFDAVVFDPPRAGAKTQVAELAASAVPVVIGVSCNPNTFARDARLLLDGGYALSHIQPVDQFLWSHHVELVGVFRK